MPEELINESPEFKCLQSRYTALVNESVHLRHQLNEARELVKCTKNIYDQQFEKIELEEFENQRKLHANFEQVVSNLAEARRDFELLQVEYEKVLIANQQSGTRELLSLACLLIASFSVPITREMRSLINHLQAQCKLYNLEASRCKKQCKELDDELNKLKSKQELNISVSEPSSIGQLQESPSSKDETLLPPLQSQLSSSAKADLLDSSEGVRLSARSAFECLSLTRTRSLDWLNIL